MGLRADAAAANLGGIESLVTQLNPADRGAYLYPCSNESPKEARVARMKDFGVELKPVEFYRNQLTTPQPLPHLAFNRVLFTSSSTVEAYFARYPEEKDAGRTWLAVGPSTLNTLRAKGFATARLLA